MEFGDKILVCKDCNEEFYFTAGEQAFYQEKKFTNVPMRCSDCRNRRKKKALELNLPSVQNLPTPPVLKEHTPIVCSKCGKHTTVPFRPQVDRPAYCKECYVKLKLTEPAPDLEPALVGVATPNQTTRYPVHLLNRLFDAEASPFDRRDAALELGQIEIYDPLTQVGLLLAVENKNWVISWAAIEALANVGDVEALKYLEQKQAQTTDEHFGFVLNNALLRIRKRLNISTRVNQI